MLDPTKFEFQDSRWKDIYLHLKEAGFNVYGPAQYEGECTEPYIVVKNDGGYKHLNYSSMREQYSIHIVVPKKRYSELEPLVMAVKKSMKELYPMIMDYGQMQPSFYDDVLKAHIQAIEYENYKKL